VPAQAEIDSQLEAYSKDQWNINMEERSKIWQGRNSLMDGMTESEKEAFRDDNSWEWMKEDDAARRKVEKSIAEYSRKLNEGFNNNRRELKRLALTLSRISPVSSFQLSAMNLANTDIDLKVRYEDVIREYKKEFYEFVNRKQEESGGVGGLMITLSSESGMKVGEREKSNLDLSEIPKFVQPHKSYAHIFQSIFIDLGLIVLFSILAFAGAFRMFLNFDLR
jgi:hypothetical protein